MAVAMIPEYGGYEYEFVEKVPDRFVCNICTKVQRDPHLTACCGQHFCQSCLENWFKKHGKKSCPHCREEKDFNHILNKAQKREIGELKIHCALHQKGCQWVGELDSLQTHLNSDSGCGYMEVSCTNKCGKKMKRKHLKSHLANSCPLRKYKCRHCSHEDTYQAIIGQHYNTCPNYPLPCPNKCGESNIKCKDMSAHREMCPLEVVNCPNKCGLKMERKDLEQHLTPLIQHLGGCRLRRYKCEHCGHEDTYQAITEKGYHPLAPSHYDTCPNYPLPCPNKKCGESNIKRKDMSAHREKCPEEPVECPLKEAGCTAKLVRRELDTHVANNQQMHILVLMRAFSQSRAELRETKITLEKQEKDLGGKTRELKEVKATLEKQEKDLGGKTRELKEVKATLEKQERDLGVMRAQLHATNTELDTTRKVIATDVKILCENKQPQASIALESIQTQATAQLTLGGEPLTIRIPNFSQYKQSGKVWHSPPFYYKRGLPFNKEDYKMSLAVYANGTGAGARTHVSVSLLLLRGEFDDQLTWGLGGWSEEIKIQLVDKTQEASQMSRASWLWSNLMEPSIHILLCTKCSDTAILRRVPDGEDSQVMGSEEKFADHQRVQQYNLLHDSIVLRVKILPHNIMHVQF